MEDTKKYNYYSQIWVEPRETIRRVVAENPNKVIWLLSCVYGFSWLLNSFQSMLIGQQISLFQTLFVAGVFSPIWGYIGFSLFSGLVTLTGKMFGGAGSFKTIRAAYAWSCFPYTVNVCVWVILCAMFGRDLFMGIAEHKQLTQVETAALFLAFVVRTSMWVWSWVIYINALSEVQKYSVIKTVGNIVVALIVFGVMFYLLLLFGVHGAHGVAAKIHTIGATL